MSLVWFSSRTMLRITPLPVTIATNKPFSRLAFLTCHSSKGTAVTNNIHNGSVPLNCESEAAGTILGPWNQILNFIIYTCAGFLMWHVNMSSDISNKLSWCMRALIRKWNLRQSKEASVSTAPLAASSPNFDRPFSGYWHCSLKQAHICGSLKCVMILYCLLLIFYLFLFVFFVV